MKKVSTALNWLWLFLGPVGILFGATGVALGVVNGDPGGFALGLLVFGFNAYSWLATIDIVTNDKLIALIKEHQNDSHS